MDRIEILRKALDVLKQVPSEYRNKHYDSLRFAFGRKIYKSYVRGISKKIRKESPPLAFGILISLDESLEGASIAISSVDDENIYFHS